MHMHSPSFKAAMQVGRILGVATEFAGPFASQSSLPRSQLPLNQLLKNEAADNKFSQISILDYNRLPGEYADHVDQCQFCEASCSKCTGPTQNDCIGCAATRFFDDGRCVLQCPKGKFEFNNQCHLCHHTCIDCNGSEPNKCTACGTDKRGKKRFLYMGECRESCPLGYYHSEKNSACLPCLEQCEMCLNSIQCNKCFKGYYLADNRCLKHECREGEVEDLTSEDCVPCADGCRRCLLDDPRICISCIHNYYMYKHHCYKDCPENTYNDDSTLQCIECDEICDSCDKYRCYRCNKDFYLLDGKCVSDCRAGFYMDENLGECEECHRTCATCEGFNYDDCTSCKENLQLLHGKCVNPKIMTVEGKFWNDTKKQFQRCDSSCRTCNRAADVCTSCPEGKFLLAETCVLTCPRGNFGDLKSRRCENCTDDCETCSNPRHCLKCQSQPHRLLYLHEGRCFQECPMGYFAETGTCIKCDKSCKTCEGNATKCQSCESPLLLEQWECKVSCSEKHFATSGICKHCPEMCQECIHESSCKVCTDQFFLHNGKCLLDCPSGFYADSNSCSPCHEDCKECDGPDSDDCNECASFFVLHNGECSRECPEGTYYETETEDCQDCDRACQTCSSSTACLTCREGMVMNGHGHCVTSKYCSLTEYHDEQTQTCKPCHKKCSRCTGPAEHQCLSCPKNWHLLNTTCLEMCPDGYYVDSDEGRCFTCHSTCETCNGKHSTQCLSCRSGWYKQSTGCVQVCTVGYYANNSTGLCERCHKSCKECLGPQHTDCLSCDKHFFLLTSKNECLPSCPEYYYEDHDTNSCERCHPTCSSCTGKGALSCTACVWSYHLAGGICYSECFAGEYKVSEGDQSECEKCHETCIECKGPGPLNCTVCPANMKLYLDESRCVQCCDGFNLTKTQECCNCSETEDECVLHTGLNLSTESKGKTALFVSTSILLILCIGAIAVIWRRSRAKAQPVNKGGYEKLTDHSKSLPSYKSNHHGSTSYQDDQVIEYKDWDKEDEDDDDDDDIVYMSQDGTVYRKFKYGLLQDEEDELEYDDESYSFR